MNWLVVFVTCILNDKKHNKTLLHYHLICVIIYNIETGQKSMVYENQTEFFKCNMIQHFILGQAGECLLHDKDFNMLDVTGFMLDSIPEIDITELNKTEMRMLGFVQPDPAKELLLIPTWLFPFLKTKGEYYDVDGDLVGDINKMTSETMYGLLLYGVYPCDVDEINTDNDKALQKRESQKPEPLE